MIRFDNTSFSYGDNKVLDGFNLTVNDGDRICLFGDSGAGKTTILRLILGLELAKDNSVTCTYGTKSVVFQENRLLPFKTVGENVSFFSKNNDVDNILSDLNISQAKNNYPSQLSGGMARRVSIARALSYDADLFIFDEPFAGLDHDNILNIINQINKITANKTLIIVTHTPEYANLLNCKIVNIT